MIRAIAAIVFVCVFAHFSTANAQCGGPYDQMVNEAYATRESLDAIERYAPPDGPARVTSSLYARARSLSRTVDDAIEYGGRVGVRNRRTGDWEEDWLEHLGALNADLDAIMPLVRVSAQLPPETRADLRRVLTALAVTGCHR